MSTNNSKPKRSVGWMGLKRGHRARPLEWIVEKGIFLISMSAIVMIFLIFLFIAREAYPVLVGKTDSSTITKVIPPAEMDQLSPEQLMEYLDLKPKQFRQMDKDTLRELMLVKVEAAAEQSTDKDAGLTRGR